MMPRISFLVLCVLLALVPVLDGADNAAPPPDWVVYPEKEWLRITPQQAGIDGDKFRQLLEGADVRGSTFGGVPVGSRDWGAMLTRGGYVVQTWGDPDYRCQSASLGKNFTWLLVALAVEDGLISADDPIHETWTGEGQLSHPHKYLDRGHHRTLTWRHLLEHRGGFILEAGHWWRKKIDFHARIPEWARWTGDPLADNYAHAKPGPVQHYSSGGYWRLGQALTALWKRDLKELLDERIFAHMGIPAARWDWLSGKTVHDDEDFYPEIPFYGEYLGPPYEIGGVMVRGAPGWVVMSASDLARFGLLIASKGWWKGKRLVSPEYLPNLQYGVGIHAFAGDPETLVSFAKLNTADFPFGGRVIFPRNLITRAVPDVARDGRMEWFKNAKFGMFVHWGPYARLAGEWRGRRVEVGSNAEWIMHKLKIPVKEYRKEARSFLPEKFNAADWVRLAKTAGMRYLVFTAKHHDGFAMYHSRVSDYNIHSWSGFKRDVLRELAETCRAEGIRFGFYYSHREDWDEPCAYGNTWDFNFSPANDLERFEKEYLDVKAKPQLRELLRDYGKIDLVWFDRGIYTQEQAREFVELVRRQQPMCIINGRVGHYGKELLGDYQNMNDNGMPPSGIEEYWETPQTHNETWGFSRFDTHWKSAEQIVRKLIEIVSKGGNYLLNVGPDGQGLIPEASVRTLTEVGRWVKANGESIYGTTANPLGHIPWGFCTTKGRTLYFHVIDWPEDGGLRIVGLRNPVNKASLLVEKAHGLEYRRDGSTLTVGVPAKAPDPIATVVVVEVDGTPDVDPVVVSQSAEGAFHLDHVAAVTEGRTAKRFNRRGKFHISKWTAPEDTARWYLDVKQPGHFKVQITYAANEDWEGQEYTVAVGKETLSGRIRHSGNWYRYKTFDLGTLSIPTAARHVLEIRPRREVPENLMYFRDLVLRP